ncbi:hypothetical protein ACFOWB_22485 [Chenggangzhangella methanolivorans]|uniref:hypothetical protein n=1 Tax=Chenggangzhangella methanolivorans TaxID=1437009 RepID=UPI00361ACB50
MSIRVSVLAAAVLAATPALAIDLPPRKPGLWETRAVIKGRYKVIRRCFRQGERSAFVDTVGIDACTRSTQKPLLLEGYLMQAECRTRGYVLRGKLQIAGDFSGDLKGMVRTTVEREDGSTAPLRYMMPFTSVRLGECGTEG